MLGEALEQNSVALLELREKERRHWSGLITILQNVTLGVNVAIWAFLLKAYIDTSKLEFVSVAAGLSAITLGMWHYYSRHFSNQSTEQYTEIMHYENSLGVPENEGLQGFLCKYIPLLKDKIFQNKDLTNEQKIKVLNILIRNKTLAGPDGGSLEWELFAPLLGLIGLNAYLFAINLTSPHVWLYFICFLAPIVGLLLWMIGYSRFQRATSARNIESALAELNNPAPEVKKKPVIKPEVKSLKKINLLPLLLGAGSLVLVLLVVLWIITTAQTGSNNNATAIMAVVTVLAVLSAAFCTYFYMKSTTAITSEMRRAREIEFELYHKPKIMLDFEPNANGNFYLIISNDGNGAAKNVKFSIDPPLKNSGGKDVSHFSALDKGINYFTSKKKLVYLFDSTDEVEKYESKGLNRVFNVKVEYDWEIEGRPKITDSYPIELTPLVETQVSSYKDTRTLIDEVEKIRKIFEKIPTD